MNGIIAVVAYRPKAGKDEQLLATDRVPITMRSRGGTIVEVSEWKSREAIDAAHKNPNVWAMSEKFFALCDCVPVNTLPETANIFAGFTPIEH